MGARRSTAARSCAPTPRRRSTFVRGEGTVLWDADGKRVPRLPRRPGRDVLGHAHPAVADAVAEQARTLCHVSNLYGTDAGARGGAHARPADQRRPGRPAARCSSPTRAPRPTSARSSWPAAGAAAAATSWSAPTARSTAAPWPRCTPPASRQKHEAFQPLPEGFRHVRLGRPRRARRGARPDASPPCCSSRCRARAA